jgi:hypothetical protein
MNNPNTNAYNTRLVAVISKTPPPTDKELLGRAHKLNEKQKAARILDAETRCAKWLADGRELEDRARDPDLSDSQRFRLCHRSVKAMEKSQYWLDRYNKLSGRV